jgi:hypothetical protein
MKTCLCCQQELPEDDFARNKAYRRATCKACERAREKRRAMKKPAKSMGPKVKVTYVRLPDGSLERRERGVA